VREALDLPHVHPAVKRNYQSSDARVRGAGSSWRYEVAADRDPTLTTMSALSKTQFNDLVPEILDAFRQAWPKIRTGLRRPEEQRGPQGAKLSRWQLGYSQREVMYEWRHLHLCLVRLELGRYAPDHADLQPTVLPRAAALAGYTVKASARRVSVCPPATN
jgi:hypothetical protein